MAKGVTPSQIEATQSSVESALSVAFPNLSFDLTNSVDWFTRRFEVCGGWDAWVWETVNGRDYQTRRGLFDGFVVTSNPMGRANAEIVKLALRAGRGVLLWSEGEPLKSVQRILLIDDNNWTAGWSVESTPIAQPVSSTP